MKKHKNNYFLHVWLVCRSFFSANFLITLTIFLLPFCPLCLISCDKICGCSILPCRFIHCYSQELFPSPLRGCFLVRCSVILLYLNISKILSVPSNCIFWTQVKRNIELQRVYEFDEDCSFLSSCCALASYSPNRNHKDRRQSRVRIHRIHRIPSHLHRLPRILHHR